jgi:8-oxo-dGTP pyrophosphatase MutT (NUDIX family)
MEVAVVHRPRYDDWSFPKGKLAPGESEEEGAVREVLEETGMRVRLGPEIGIRRYQDRHGRDKTVRYWRMVPEGGRFTPSDEVDRLEWLPVHEALARLTYEGDRQLLRTVDERGRQGTGVKPER